MSICFLAGSQNTVGLLIARLGWESTRNNGPSVIGNGTKYVEEIEVIGCIGVLEILYRRSELADLRETYVKLLANKIRIDLPTLQESLSKFSLPLL